MKSNFLPLHTAAPSQLFTAINLAEQLFVAGHHHFVPTAIRSFCEGVLLTALGEEHDRTRPPSLRELSAKFSDKYNLQREVRAVERIRKSGNEASHYDPKHWSEKELIKLFKEAVILQSFLLREVYNQDGDYPQFSRDALPDIFVTEGSVADDESCHHIVTEMGSRSSLSRPLQKYSQQLTEYRDQSRRLNIRLSLYRHEESHMSRELQNVQIQCHEFKQELKAAQRLGAKAANEISERQRRLEVLQTTLEAERLAFQRRIASLEEEKRVLGGVKRTLHEQIVLELKAWNEKDMADKLPELSLEQQAMVEIHEGRHFLIAPPGAGKTTILTHRLRQALRIHDDTEIVCLTFTTRAAQEMQERASSILQDRSPFIGNFHAFCLDQMRNSDRLDWKSKQFGILDDRYRDALWHQAMKTCVPHEGKPVDSDWLSLAGHYQGQLIQPFAADHDTTPLNHFRRGFLAAYIDLLLLDVAQSDALRQRALQLLQSKVAALLSAAHFAFHQDVYDATDLATKVWSLFCKFRELKQQSQSFDFDDILCFGLVETIHRQHVCSFLQVDEVQDLAPIQWEIIHALSDEKTHLFVVGDPEQSIYGFLGADLKALEQRTREFHKHSLIGNFRSRPKIVALLNHYRMVHWSLPAIKAREDVEDDQSTLLFCYPTDIAELDGNIFALRKILEYPGRNVGILLATNKACDSYCAKLQAEKIAFFRVGQFDLMQKALIQDWLSLLRVYHGGGTRGDWWRLAYRFAKSRPGNNSVTQANAMEFVNRLHDLGVSVHDVTFDWIARTGRSGKTKPNLTDNRIRKLRACFVDQGVVVFDTETTGLDLSKDEIVQLAAVRVVDGKVVDTFNEYLKLDFSGKPDLKQRFEKSVEVHGISHEDIANARLPSEVLADFFRFVGESPLVAHNLTFDRTMLSINVDESLYDYQLLRAYQKMADNLHFDSLQITRLLFPDQQSYKLANLLTAFNLEGVNSHNALDDVIATASLLTHLLRTLETRWAAIDQTVTEHAYLVESIVQHWTPLNRLLKNRIEGNKHAELADILEDWLTYALAQAVWYKESPEALKQEVEQKLMPWLRKNQYQGLFGDLLDESQPKVERLFTLKESDLIDPHRHRIVVSTVHRAKGLEFDSVIVPHATDGAYPPWSADETPSLLRERRIQEGCRLLYVAMSRPKRKLIVSYHTRFKSWNRKLSTFLQPCESVFSWPEKKH